MELKNGYPIVKSVDDIKTAEKTGTMFYYAICPKCNDGWTSVLQNAKHVVSMGCLPCNDFNAWKPEVEIKEELDVKENKEDLIRVMQEANYGVLDKIRGEWSKLPEDECRGKLIEHYIPFYKRVVSEYSSVEAFINFCFADLKMQAKGMHLLGGGVLNPNEKTVIQITQNPVFVNPNTIKKIDID